MGLHKTGTTFLQEDVFSKFDIPFLKKPDFGIIENENEPTSLARFMGSQIYIWRELGNSFLRQAIEEARCNTGKGEDLLISDEQGPFREGRNDACIAALHLKEMKSIAEREFSNLKVIIAIRRQDQWLPSAYSQMSNRYKKASQSDFENFVHKSIQQRKKLYNSCGVRLKYDLMIKELYEKIGKNNVEVIPYEILIENPQQFLSKLSEIVGLKEIPNIEIKSRNKRSSSKYEWNIRPYMGSEIVNIYNDIGFERLFEVKSISRDDKIILNKQTKRKITEAYQVSNKKADKMIEWNLEKLGYY